MSATSPAAELWVKIPLQKMYELYLSKILIWDEKYKIKFIEKYKENNDD
jgi:hypothetical protein